MIRPLAVLLLLALAGPGPRPAAAAKTIVATPTVTSVTEGASGNVNVRLEEDPGPGITVTVTPGVYIGGLSGTFVPSQMQFTGGAAGNWDVDQVLSFSAPEDGDLLDGSATISLFAVGYPYTYVVVKLLDNDRPPGSPTASITAPVHGDTVFGTNAAFSGTGTDDVVPTLAQFFVDGVQVGPDVPGAGPYHVNGAPGLWNTTALSNGNHVLRLTVSDGTLTASHEITVNVQNGSTGGGSSGGGCGALGVEVLLLLLLRRVCNVRNRFNRYRRACND